MVRFTDSPQSVAKAAVAVEGDGRRRSRVGRHKMQWGEDGINLVTSPVSSVELGGGRCYADPLGISAYEHT